MSLRILHVCPRPSFSGLEAYALDLAKGQLALGCDVRMVVLAGSPLAAKARAAGLSLIEMANGVGGRWELITRLIGDLRAAQGPQIVHLHSTQDIDLMLAPLLVSRLRGARRPRVILQTHIWISHSKKDPLHALSYTLIDEVWCSSTRAAETLARFLPIPKAKIRIINYGREVERMESAFLDRAAARRKLGLPDDAIVVGSVARIDEGKGTRELLEGALLAMQTHPRLNLILIGPPTADDPKAILFAKMIQERIDGLPPGLRSRVFAPGAVPDSFQIMKAFDLFALPTYHENFALSLLESLLAGVPVLATASGGSPEVVREGETGWLFEARSIDSLHQALERALREQSRWTEFGENGRARVHADFDFTKILPRTVSAYRDLLEPRAPAVATRA